MRRSRRGATALQSRFRPERAEGLFEEPMIQLDDPSELRRWSRSAVGRGETIAFVPTMGYLHEGHLSLMRIARDRADRVVVSIFVNPLQFAEGEDLSTYPRDSESDLAACESEGVDVVFMPGDLYPTGFATGVTVRGVSSGLCGATRASHFDGMATVVLKLFNLVGPSMAVFGEKDFQQLQVVRRMVRDLDLDIEVLGGPIVRDVDGVALSSRNAYLSAEERSQATVLNRSLIAAEGQVAAGERDPRVLVTTVQQVIEAEPLAHVDYVELVDAESLEPLSGRIDGPVLLALAVRFGGARLIDNRVLGTELSAP